MLILSYFLIIKIFSCEIILIINLFQVLAC